MFSSGSQVECFGLHPFHLTKYSVLPFLNLFFGDGLGGKDLVG